MIKLGIVGATGVVGRKVLQVLEEKNLPIDEYMLFASKKSAGLKIKFMGKDYIVKELTENEAKKAKLNYAIFSAGTEVSKRFSPIFAKTGTIVIDNSNAFRMDKNVPLIVPEVNPEEIKNNKGIIANPNCSTIQAVVALKPLDEKYKIERIVYTTFQAVSGAGRKGIENLEYGIDEFEKNKIANDKSLNNEKQKEFDKNNKQSEIEFFNNCVPQIDIFVNAGYTREETKMINETRKILKREDLKITATCVRVPVFNSHSESINIEFEKEFKLDDVKNILKKSKNIIVVDENQQINYDFIKETGTEKINYKKYNLPFPIATMATENDKVFVGRIRRDFSVKNGLNIWVVADNIRKGAATNAVQILEILLKNNKN